MPILPTPFQQIVQCLPEEWNLALTGGRGGGKTSCVCQLVSTHCEKYRAEAKVLYLRIGPYESLSGFATSLNKHFNDVWGLRAHRYSEGNHRWSVPTGSEVELSVLPDGREGQKVYEEKHQGRDRTLIIIDEAQAWAQHYALDMLASNLRSPVAICRFVLLANPGGPGHQIVAQRYVNNGVGNWKPFVRTVETQNGSETIVSRLTWINCPSTYRDNPHNGQDYLNRLAMSAQHDTELLQAWLSGNWNIARGAYFAAVLDNPRVKINWPRPENWGKWKPTDWQFDLCYDHGSASPAVAMVTAESPGGTGPDGRYYSEGSILFLDEFARHRPGNLSEAYNEDVEKLAPFIKALAERWKIKPAGPADDEIFSHDGHQSGSIADEYRRLGINWRPANKGGRAQRFLKMKRLLSHAGFRERPGMYVSEACSYWWQTVPFIVHDPNNREVPLKGPTDHALDSSSYRLSGGAVPASGVTSISWV